MSHMCYDAKCRKIATHRKLTDDVRRPDGVLRKMAFYGRRPLLKGSGDGPKNENWEKKSVVVRVHDGGRESRRTGRRHAGSET